jgi:two-component system KDP operon response regulator KdpE
VRHAARTATGVDATFTVGDLRVDLARRQVFIDGKEVHLTPIEYKLLTALVRHAGKVLTHAQLLKEVWGPSHGSEAPYLRIYIMQLRRKPKRIRPGLGIRRVVGSQTLRTRATCFASKSFMSDW